MTDFENNIQGNISFYNNNTAQFRLLWTIHEYKKLKTSVNHPDYFDTTLPVNVLPNKFALEIQFHPNGNSKVTEKDYTSIFVGNLQNSSTPVWMSSRFALLDKNKEEKYIKYASVTEFGADNKGFARWFPVDVPNDEAKTLFPNDCLQILVEGVVWSEEPVDKTKNVNDFHDCDITSSLRLYQSGAHTDGILSVGEEEFQVHKNILCAKSSVFQEMFKESSQNIIVIPDIRKEVFQEVINFLYTDTVTAMIDTMLPDVLIVANKYELNYLAEICQIKMIKNLSVDNCVEYLQTANSCGASQLKENVLGYITKNRKLVFQNEQWKELRFNRSNELLLEILDKLMIHDCTL